MSWNPDSEDTNSQSQYGGYTGASRGQYQQQQQYTDAATGTGQQQQQQYGAYQPPESTLRSRSSSTHGPTSTGLKATTAAVLSYLFFFIGGLIFLIIERKNRFVRFAAAQSLLFFVFASILVNIVKFIGGIWLIGILVQPLLLLLYILFTLIWLYLMFQAYRGKTVHLPLFGLWADWLVDKTTHRPKTKII